MPTLQLATDGCHDGCVYLVGAGPGDPRLLTLRAVQCLARADVVLYDYLVNPQILSHARPGAELVCLGRHGHGRILLQQEINDRLVALARQGRIVVRLKGGDPAVFARGADEALALADAGVRYEIVPGITAALAAGSYAGIPITHRDMASAVAFVTGQEHDEKQLAGLDYRALAAFPGTLVFYMGVTTVGHWSGELVAAGKPADTPAAIIRRCSFPDQETVYGTLGTLAERVATARLRPPVVFVIGPVVSLGPTLDWFSRRPLAGQRVLVTRPREQTESLAEPLAELGADVLLQPAIEIGPPPDWRPVDDALARLNQFDWLVFSSANGVRAVLDRLLATGGDARRLASVRLAAIGPGTADELARYHLHADLTPREFRAESLAAALVQHDHGGVAGQRFLLARASRGREVLADELVAAGGQVEQVVVYSSTDVARPDDEIIQALAAGKIDWVTVTSSAIARSLATMLGETLRRSKLVSISPITSATLAELGYPPAAEADQYTIPGVVAAIRQYPRTDATQPPPAAAR